MIAFFTLCMDLENGFYINFASLIILESDDHAYSYQYVHCTKPLVQ